MGKLERSWLLLKQSLSIMTRNRMLLVFPVIVMLFTVLMLIVLVAPAVLRPTGHSYMAQQHWEAIGHSLFTQTLDADGKSVSTGLTPAATLYVALLYLVSMFLATFFNVAFYHEILAALNGEPVVIGRGLRFACSRWKAVLMWSLFAGLVGLIIQQIEQRLSFVGQIVARFIGMAWSVASVFVIPVMVQDKQSANPIGMLRNSALLLKRTWGEALIGYVGLSLASSVILFASLVLVLGALVASIMLNNYWLVGVVGVFWLLAMLVLSYLTSIAGQVYKGALYRYAADGVVAEPFSQQLLDSAWKHKKKQAAPDENS